MRFNELEEFFRRVCKFRHTRREAGLVVVPIGIFATLLLAYLLVNLRVTQVHIPGFVTLIAFITGSFMVALYIHRYNQLLSFLTAGRVRTVRDRWQARMKAIGDELRDYLHSNECLNRDAIQSLLQINDRTLATVQPLISPMTAKILSIGFGLILGGITYLARWQSISHGSGSAWFFIGLALELFLLTLGMSFVVPPMVSSLDFRRNRLHQFGILLNEILLGLFVGNCTMDKREEQQDKKL